MSFSKLSLTLALILSTALPAAAGNDAAGKVKIPPFYPQQDRATLDRVIAADTNPKEVAVAWFGLAGLHVDGAAHKAVDQLSELSDIKSDPLMQAYLGSAYIMKARDQSFVPSRVRSVRRGLKWLEGAVKAAPNDFEIRTMRAATTINLPEIFDYQATTRSDLEKLIRQIDAGQAPVARGTAQEGRMIAALGKVCAEQQDLTCAQGQIRTLQENYAGNPELRKLATELSAALPK